MLRIGIVGGGIGGLAAAIALKQAGHLVAVFERAAAISEVGSGLTLWANATRALRYLGALAHCLPRSQAIRLFHLRLACGRVLMHIPIESFATEAIAMHRCDLQAALLGALPGGCIETSSACLGLREDRHGVFLRFADGERGPYDLVVGADGVRSTVRSYVSNAKALKYQGYAVWRGVAEVPLLDYPAGSISETWGRGRRFGILPLGQGRVCWYATANQAQDATTLPAKRRAKVHGLVAGWHAPIADLVAATPDILENPALDRDSVGGWSRGATVIIGDAAHPLTPNLGQGVCMALEDAVVLGRLFAAKGIHKSAVAGLLTQYEALRAARVAAIARRCRWLGAIGQWQHPLLTPLRNRVARALPGSYFAYTSRSIQAYAAEAVEAALGGNLSRAKRVRENFFTPGG